MRRLPREVNHLDIVIGILLAMRNKKIVLARGRKPGGFIALTLVLWFGLEIVGAAIGSLLGWGLYDMSSALYLLALAYGMAGIGALIAYLAAKSCKPGNYYPAPPVPYQGMPYGAMPYGAMPYGAMPYGAVTPVLPKAEPLETPAVIDIIRDYSMRGDITSWKFILNEETVGSLGNGAARSVETRQRQNTLRAISEDGRECAPLLFNIESGGHAEIHFMGEGFVPAECKGISPQVFPPPPAAPAVPPYVPPAPQPVFQPVQAQDTIACATCGVQISRDSKFCKHCGAKQP